MRTNKKLRYPDNIWAHLFGESAPVPEDAEETLEVMFREAELSDEVREVVDVYYKQANNGAETKRILGKTQYFVHDRLSKARRKLRPIGYRAKNGMPLRFGLAANKRMAEEKAAWCSVCNKLIEENDPCFVVPGGYSPGLFDSPVFVQSVRRLRLCCSKECATELAETVAKQCRQEIENLRIKERSLEDDVKRYEDYKPTPLSLKAALEELEKLDEE